MRALYVALENFTIKLLFIYNGEITDNDQDNIGYISSLIIADFNEYKIIFGNNFYGYEHALKVSIEKKGKKKINEVMIQDLFSDKEKSIFKLSEMD